MHVDDKVDINVIDPSQVDEQMVINSLYRIKQLLLDFCHRRRPLKGPLRLVLVGILVPRQNAEFVVLVGLVEQGGESVRD